MQIEEVSRVASLVNEYDIDQVEAELKEAFVGIRFVGEADIDHWAPAVELSLLERSRGHSAEFIARLWPRTMCIYLVHCVLNHDQPSHFWESLTIPELRNGQETGPVFISTLEHLGLDTFPNIELIEGIAEGSRFKYIRRIQLHGGVPRHAVGHVLRFLNHCISLGISEPGEIVSYVEDVGVANDVLRSRSAARFLQLGGEFASRTISTLIEIVNEVNSGATLDTLDVPQHLKAGVQDFIDNRGRNKSASQSQGRTRIALDPLQGNPYLMVPRHLRGNWNVNGQSVALESGKTGFRCPLPLPDLRGWRATVQTNEERTERHFSGFLPGTRTLVFTEKGLPYRPGADLHGHTAYVVSDYEDEIPGEFETRGLDGEWEDFFVSCINLRELSELCVPSTSGTGIAIPITHDTKVDLLGSVPGCTTDSKSPVFADGLYLKFTGYRPPLDQIAVRTPDGDLCLKEIKEQNGRFDLSPHYKSDPLRRAQLKVTWDEEILLDTTVMMVPGLKIHRSAAYDNESRVEVKVQYGAAAKPSESTVYFRPDQLEGTTSVSLRGRTAQLVVKIQRLSWTISGKHSIFPVGNTERFAIKLPELHEQTLNLRGGVEPLTVQLCDHTVQQVERSRPKPGPGTWQSLPLSRFIDSARASSAALLQLKVETNDEDSIRIGVIEARYAPLDLKANVDYGVAGDSVSLNWTELSEWPDRIIRMWDSSGTLAVSHPVAAGTKSAKVHVPPEISGLLRVEIVSSYGGLITTPPTEAANCASVYVNDHVAREIEQEIRNGNPRSAVEDLITEDYFPLLATLLLELSSSQDSNTDQLQLLSQAVCHDGTRAGSFLLHLVDRVHMTARKHAADNLRLAVFPLLVGLWMTADEFEFSLSHTEFARLWSNAPLAAMCIDREAGHVGNRATTSDERWRDYAGLNLQQFDSADKARTFYGAAPTREVRRTGQPVRPLSPEAWSAAISTIGTLCKDQDTESQLTRMVRRAQGFELEVKNAKLDWYWRGSMLRLKSSLKQYHIHGDILWALGWMISELLDPPIWSVERSREVKSYVRDFFDLDPETAQTVFTYVTAMHRLRTVVGEP